ncbi:hypothetical protein [Dyella mobilis]|uniref:Uncharacterized protein n=1 Tax=Dyella mobilis TaxID=1849582 RepID=A0ABS2KGG3_9GAMM|nr:hypothetical protein [Dyella mobilis]MBM7130130.1 hypothetical protein [Dyella mobilis]
MDLQDFSGQTQNQLRFRHHSGRAKNFSASDVLNFFPAWDAPVRGRDG